MNLFRNITIKTRLVLTFLISVLFPVVVFGYVNISRIDVSPSTTFFLCIISVIIAIVTSLLVASSIVAPLQIIQSSLQAFAIRKTAGSLNDKGLDEISDVSSDLNRMYEEWNKEVINLGKRQIKLDKENEKTNVRANTIEAQLAQTRSLLSLAQELNITFDFQTNCKAILDEAIKTLNIQWGSIILLDREKNEMRVACVRGIEKSLLDDLALDNYPAIRLKPHEGLAGLVIKEGLPLIANKGHKDPRFKQFSEFNNRDEKVASLLCAPIIGKDGNILGVINLINRQIPPVFRNEDIPYAKDLCILAAIVIERNRMYKNIFTDALTNLLAHNVWLGYLEEEASRSHRYCQSCSVLIFDIDDFKTIADKTNEEFISNIIGECGKTIAGLLRDSDKASSNQERFFCLLPNTAAAGAVYFSGRVKEAIEAAHFKYNKKDYQLTLSVGISTYPDNIKDSKAILKSALQAVVNAHKAGGNRAVIYKE